MSSVMTPRSRRTAYSASPKSSPTGPITRVSARKEEASAKWTAAPPSSRSRLCVCVSTASNAMDPTTVRLMRPGRVSSAAVRAIRISEWGGPEVLELVEDAPVPEPGDGQVLIRVARAGVNFADTHARENSYLARYELPLTPGAEVAGTVERDGGGFRAGQRVVSLVGTGGYAEYVAAEAVDVRAEDLAERLIEANGGERVDAVFEMAGGSVFEASMKALAPFGRLVTYGIASREQNEVSTGALMRRSHAVVGFWLMHCLRDPGMVAGPLPELSELVASGDLRVVEGECYALSD